VSPRRGIPFVVSAPSGTGKTTVCKEIVARDPQVDFSISHTTRARRGGERDGADYHFVSRPQFAALRARGAFVEHAEYAGNLYGTSRRALDGPLSAGRDLLLEVEVQGAAQLRQHRPDARFIFLLPPSWQELERRLRGRGTDSAEALAERLRQVRTELRALRGFDYALVNHELQQTVSALLEIVRAERRGDVAAVRAVHGREPLLRRMNGGDGIFSAALHGKEDAAL